MLHFATFDMTNGDWAFLQKKREDPPGTETSSTNTLVFATHGLIKKVDKMPGNEIGRAEKIRAKYFEHKTK
jgi:hypothetical protein